MIKNFINQLTHTPVSLRFGILFIFISLFCITTVFIIGIQAIVLADELTYTALALMQHVSDSKLHELISGLRPVEMQGKFSAHLIQSQVLKNNIRQLMPYTFYLVKHMPLIVGAYWGNEKGALVASYRERNGTITSEIITRTNGVRSQERIYRDIYGNVIQSVIANMSDFDPRLRPWYLAAQNTHATIWTDIYKFYPHGGMGLTVVSPVFHNNKNLAGVLGLDIRLDYLSKFISKVQLTRHGYAFIIKKNEDLIAFPNKGPFLNLKVKPYTLVNVHSSKLPLIDQSLDLYKMTGKTEMEVKYNQKTYLITYQTVPDLKNHAWLIGVVTPKSDFTHFLQKVNTIILITCLFVWLVGIFIVSNLVARVVRPINLLVRETEKIKRLELDDGLPLNSRIKEVVSLRNAIVSMKRGLRHFQKYVPKILVRQLIESGQDMHIGGVRKQLVVFFSDIQNFTSIAEKTDPNELMLQVCEYFEALSQIIIDERGTIDKYIGDSIMVFWGAPISEENPCDHAARAALRCEAKLDKLNAIWESQGKSRLITRIGIHLGEAIVGNLGSTERLNYTALGDTINIAKRIETINKVYKTNIMISEAVNQIIQERFVTRKVDCVAVKGKTQVICLYELLSDDSSKLSFDIDAYRQAFANGYASYEKQQYTEAIIYFSECLKIYPADELAPLFIKRCKHS